MQQLKQLLPADERKLIFCVSIEMGKEGLHTEASAAYAKQLTQQLIQLKRKRSR